jgi:hypothetical protein
VADLVQPLLSGVTPSATGTFYSTAFPTRDCRDFAFVLRMPLTGNTGAGTVNFFVECSNEQNFTNAYKIRTLPLYAASALTTAQTKFTEVTNNLTLPAATETATPLRQEWQVLNQNVDQYIRIRYVITGTPADFANINLDLLYNRRV